MGTMYRIATKGMKESWKILFETTELKAKFEECMRAVLETCDEDCLTPSINNILNWTRFAKVDDIKIIILGMDPYPTEGDADGLCFSTNAAKCPGSLRNILKCLHTSKLTNGISKIYSLSNWARQGVLLINASFTTIIGKTECHIKIWSAFTNLLIQTISAYHVEAEKILIWMLWGQKADVKDEFIDDYHRIYRGIHPSPQNGIKFHNCIHFLDANQELEEQGRSQITWDPVIRHVVYTDGSANLHYDRKQARQDKINGKYNSDNYRANKDSTAAWAFYIQSGPLRGKKESGPVFIKEKLTVHEENDEGTLIPRLYTAYPTSVRAEGIAIIKALGVIYNHSIHYKGIIVIKTDSHFWYDVFNTWKWVTKKRDVRTKLNIDIIDKLREFYIGIKRNIGNLEVHYIPASHGILMPDKEDEEDEEYIDYIYNTKVDLMAKEARMLLEK